MKRKLDDTDAGCFNRQVKISPSGRRGYPDYSTPPTSSPGRIGQPILSSTPQSQYYKHGSNVRRDKFASIRPHTPAVQPHLSQSADTELRHVIDNFVAVYEQLDKSDDVDVKPNYSYTELAYLAMLRSQNFCLPIAEIYSYIQGRFKFFRNSTRKHWKNAVRHSLAKTMCFSKIAVGRGRSNNESLSRSTYLWCIIPNSISSFARGDYRATVDKETGTNTLRSAYFSTNAGQFWDRVGDYIASKMVVFRTSVENTQNPGAILESQTCTVAQKPDVKTSSSTPYRQAFTNVKNKPASQDTVPSRVTTSCNLGYQSFNDFNVSPQILNQNYKYHVTNAHAQSASPHSYTGSNQSYTGSSHSHSGAHCNYSSDVITDSWLQNFPIQSPDTSCGTNDLSRSSPQLMKTELGQMCSTPYSQYIQSDSGFETAESLSSESSCQFMNSCKLENDQRDTASPDLAGLQFNDENIRDNFDNIGEFDLPPLSMNDLSDFSDIFDDNTSTTNLWINSQVQSPEPPTYQEALRYTESPQILHKQMLPGSCAINYHEPQFGYAYNLGTNTSTLLSPSVVGYTTDGRPVFSLLPLQQQQQQQQQQHHWVPHC